MLGHAAHGPHLAAQLQEGYGGGKVRDQHVPETQSRLSQHRWSRRLHLLPPSQKHHHGAGKQEEEELLPDEQQSFI